MLDSLGNPAMGTTLKTVFWFKEIQESLFYKISEYILTLFNRIDMIKTNNIPNNKMA